MKHIKFILILIFFPSILFGQKLTWNAGLNFFFDNTEYAGSSYTIDQTMAGVHLAPEIGVKWERNHAIFGGANVQRNLGMTPAIYKVNLLAYYQYKDERRVFRAGSFLKNELLDDYSNLFFQDSVRYYRPTMDGLYFKKGDKNRFIKLWLDWTGLQSDTVRESFFLGASGYYTLPKGFFMDFQSYVFHYSVMRPVLPDQHVCDNILAQASIGYRYSDKNGCKILVSGGVMGGFERNRKFMDDAYVPIGFVGRADAEYKRFGMENLLYAGKPRMKMYGEFGNELYWGNPFLRGNFYLQNKLYWKVFDTKYVQGELAARTHFSEGKVFLEQMFTLSAKIGK